MRSGKRITILFVAIGVFVVLGAILLFVFGRRPSGLGVELFRAHRYLEMARRADKVTRKDGKYPLGEYPLAENVDDYIYTLIGLCEDRGLLLRYERRSPTEYTLLVSPRKRTWWPLRDREACDSFHLVKPDGIYRVKVREQDPLPIREENDVAWEHVWHYPPPTFIDVAGEN